MFKFFTIIMLIIYTIRIFTDSKGFLKLCSKFFSFGYIPQNEIKAKIKENKEYGEIGMKLLFRVFNILLLMLIEFIYLLNAFKYDIFQYPTIIFLLFNLINFLILLIASKIKGMKMSEKERFDKMVIKYSKSLNSNLYTIKSKVITLLNIIYYSYMLWIVFIK